MMYVERSSRKSKINKKAQRDIPGLDTRVRNLLNLTRSILADCKSPQEEDHFGLMVQVFLKRQIEHTESLLLLLDNKREFDAQLITRSMMEGLAQLFWTAKDSQKRALRWRSYAFVDRWRVLQRRLALGEPVDNAELSNVETGLAQYGKIHMTTKALKKLKQGKTLPKDPYHKSWVGETRPRDIFADVGGELIYLHLYTSLSAWHHWSPGALDRIIASIENNISYDTESPATKATALANAFQCLHHTVVLVNSHLNLKYERKLKRIHRELITWYDNQPQN